MPLPEPRRLRLFLAAALFALTACHGDGAARTETKPGAPLSVAIEPQGAIERGTVGEFTVTATALADSDDFSLEVDLPDGLALYSGDLHRQGAVRRGTRFVLTFALRIPETGHHVITAVARLRQGGAGLFESRADHTIGAPPAAAPAAAPGVATRRNGEAVREYRLP